MVDHGSPEGHGRSTNTSFVNSSLLGVAISLPIIATISVLLRLYARRLGRDAKLRADDWTIIITLVLCWAHSTNTIIGGVIGGINTINMPPREYVNIALRTLWISSFFLVTSLYTVKLSILLFYYHLFSISNWFRKSIFVMTILITLWWLSSILLIFLSTDPLSSSWNDAAHAHHRYNFNHWYLSYSALSIFFDVVILLFPLPMIKSLHINTKQKISMLGIFWLGGFVCVSAVIRFAFLLRQIYNVKSLGENMFSAITTAFIWAEIEPNTAILAACLPTYGPYLKSNRFLNSVIRPIQKCLRIPTKSTHSATTSPGAPNIGMYYKFEESISSKSTGDLFNDKTTKKWGFRAEITSTNDVEAQRSMASNFDQAISRVPKAWIVR